MNKLITLIVISFAFIISGCNNGNENNFENQESNGDRTSEVEQESFTKEETSLIANDKFFESYEGELTHIHGLGYAGNQGAIFIATHDGLKVYQAGKWFKTTNQNHDYMGFSPVSEGFYTSGHPAHGSNLPNPLGIKRSFDNGKSLENLVLEGESDFHAMSVGYNNHMIVVLNGHKNSLMGEGLYKSTDDGVSWQKVKAQGLPKEIFSIAVHPSDEKLLAVANKNGIFLSKDGGNQFNQISESGQGTAVHFSMNNLWYGKYTSQAELIKYSLTVGEAESVTLPNFSEDAIMYLAENPKNSSEVAFVTFKGDVYLSKNSGEAWKTLVKGSKIQ